MFNCEVHRIHLALRHDGKFSINQDVQVFSADNNRDGIIGRSERFKVKG